MKTEKSLIIYIIPLITVCCGQAQSTFRNLEFEAASLVPVAGDPYGSVEFAHAFPGWTGSVGGVQQTSSLYDNLFLDSSGFAILDQFSSFGVGIEGNFTAVLEAGLRLGSSEPADTTLSQSGLIFAGTRSLLFKARPGLGLDSFAVTLGGQPLSLVPLQTGANYTQYGADIHAFAGQLVQLTFTAFAQNPHVIDNILYLDAIQFSTQSVPEPGVPVLFAIGIALLGAGSMIKRLDRIRPT
jgi:hypothetical protein